MAIGCSWDKTIKLTNLEANAVIRTMGGPRSTKGHQKAILGFDWSNSTNLIASCGGERFVYVWNPFIGNPIFKLDGYSAPLVDCVFHENQLITMSTDKAVKVWDIRTFGYVCMQRRRHGRPGACGKR